MKCKLCKKKEQSDRGLCVACYGKPFEITSVCRGDLPEGTDMSKVDDGTMSALADKMSDAYLDGSYWEDLEIILKYLLEKDWVKN